MQAHTNEKRELGILSCIIEHGRAQMHAARSVITDPMAFSSIKNRMLWVLLCRMDDEGQLDTCTVSSSLLWDMMQCTPEQEAGGSALGTVADRLDGGAYVLDVTNAGWCSTVVLPGECQALVEAYTRRQITKILSVAAEKAGQPTQDPHKVWDDAQSEILGYATPSNGLMSITDAYMRHVQQEQAIADQNSAPMTWSIDGLDNSAALRQGRYYVLSARPAGGKTSCGLQVAIENARLGIPTVFVSLELSASELAGKAVKYGWRTSEASIAHLSLLGGQQLKASELKSRLKRLARGGFLLIIVDYLQLVAREPRQSEYEAVSDASRACMEAARDDGACVIALAQLNRESEKGKEGEPPKLSDLRGSGQIEQDAFGVIFIHRTGPKFDACVSVDLVIGKNRFGPEGKVGVMWDKPTGRFYKELTVENKVHAMATRQESADEDLFD